MDKLLQSEMQSAIDLGKSIGTVQMVNGVPMVIVPKGYEVNFHPDIQPELHRIEETRILQTIGSFVEFVNEFKTDEMVIFIDDAKNSFQAIFDYHKDAFSPDYCKFKASYECPYSDEWAEWKNRNRVKMDQWTFAQFIESNIADIVEPSGAEMLSCVLAIESVKTVDFSSAIRLNDGQVQFKYEEEINGSKKNDSFKIPEEFSIGVPIFKNGKGYKIKAKLRYRIKDSGLSLWYELIKPQKTIDDAFEGVKEIVENEIDAPTYI